MECLEQALEELREYLALQFKYHCQLIRLQASVLPFLMRLRTAKMVQLFLKLFQMQ